MAEGEFCGIVQFCYVPEVGSTLCMQALQQAHFTEPFAADQAKHCIQWSSRNFLQQ